jgi:hypothetical protein
MRLLCSKAIQPNLELKTLPKQLLGSLLLNIALPDMAQCFHQGTRIEGEEGSVQLTS